MDRRSAGLERATAVCRAKVRYSSRSAAQRARWRASRRQGGLVLSSYRCWCCEAWHLTSKRVGTGAGRVSRKERERELEG